jgi:hypothetical protein
MSDDELKRVMAKKGKAADDQGWMEAVLRMGDGATFQVWYVQMHAIKGWSRPTFKRRLQDFKQQRPELTGGRWWGDPYSLPTQPTAAMVERVALLRTWFAPGRAFSSRTVSLTEPGPVANQTGSVGLRDLDLIARARAHVKSAKME